MLAITRRVGERLIIDDEISITVLDVKNNIIRLGIDAPKEIEIYREEIYLKVLKERKVTQERASNLKEKL